MFINFIIIILDSFLIIFIIYNFISKKNNYLEFEKTLF